MDEIFSMCDIRSIFDTKRRFIILNLTIATNSIFTGRTLRWYCSALVQQFSHFSFYLKYYSYVCMCVCWPHHHHHPDWNIAMSCSICRVQQIIEHIVLGRNTPFLFDALPMKFEIFLDSLSLYTILFRLVYGQYLFSISFPEILNANVWDSLITQRFQ